MCILKVTIPNKEHTMTSQDVITFPTELLEYMAEHGLDILPELNT